VPSTVEVSFMIEVVPARRVLYRGPENLLSK